MKKTAYSYIRWSSEKQRDGDSKKRQEDARNRWLAANPDYQLDETISLKDESVSSFRGKNIDEEFGDLGKFIALANSENSPIPPNSVLLVEALDRWSRAGALEALYAMKKLVRAGVDVVIVNDNLWITNKNMGNMEVLLPSVTRLCLAHAESERKSINISSAWERKREQVREKNTNELYSPQIPAWCSIDKKTKKIIPIQKHVEIVKYIFRRTIEGIGQKTLCRELNEKYKPMTKPKLTKQNTYTTPRWNLSYLCDLLNNRQVLGELQPRKRTESGKYQAYGKPIPDYFPRVISDKEFYAARMAIEQKKRDKYHESTKFVNLLSGLVFNGADKRKMHLMTTRVIRGGGTEYRQRRFQSHGKKDGVKGVCPLSVDYYSLEKLVLLSLSELSPDDLVGNFKPNLEKSKLLQSIEGYKNRIKELENELSNPNSCETGSVIIDAIKKLNSNLHRDIEEFESLASIPATKKSKLKDIEELQKLFSSLKDSVELNTRYELKRLLPTLIRRVIVFPYKRQNRKVAARAVVELRAGKIRRLIVMPDKVNKDVPVITYYGLNKSPAVALCNVGMVIWQSKEDGEVVWEKLSDLKTALVRHSGSDIAEAKQDDWDNLKRAILFHEVELFNASKGGIEFVDPFGPPEKLLAIWKSADRLVWVKSPNKGNQK